MGWVNAGAKKSWVLSSYPFEAKKYLLARNASMTYYYVEVDTSILNVTFPKRGR